MSQTNNKLTLTFVFRTFICSLAIASFVALPLNSNAVAQSKSQPSVIPAQAGTQSSSVIPAQAGTQSSPIARKKFVQSSSKASPQPSDNIAIIRKKEVVQVDWTTLPSTYTHNENGQRVDQFAEGVQPQSNDRADFVRSGYRNSRSSLQVGFGSDNYHVVEKWGEPVQPYGEWRYPYRPFSVPYGAWGPQLPQVVAGAGGGVVGVPFGGGGGMPFGGMGVQPGAFNGNGFGGNGFGGGGFGGGNGQGQFGVGPNNALGAGQDEYYPQAPFLQAPYQSPLR